MEGVFGDAQGFPAWLRSDPYTPLEGEIAMATVSDGTPDAKRIKEAFLMLAEAVRLLAIDANGKTPNHKPLERALEEAKKAAEHIHTGTVTRSS
jgi:hypothetical protein